MFNPELFVNVNAVGGGRRFRVSAPLCVPPALCACVGSGAVTTHRTQTEVLFSLKHGAAKMSVSGFFPINSFPFGQPTAQSSLGCTCLEPACCVQGVVE